MTGLQADSVSAHYLAECKNVKTPATLAKWWQQICVKASEWGKDPILLWQPSNGDLYKVNGKRLPNMHIITEERHAELLLKEQAYDASNRAGT